MRLTHFGGLTLGDTGEENDVAPAEVRNATIELRDGVYDQDGVEAVFRPGRVSKRYIIDEDTQALVYAAMDDIADWVSRGERVLKGITYDGTQYRQTFAKAQYSQRSINGSDLYCWEPVVLTFDIHYPFWMATDDEPYYLDNGHDLDDGWYLDGNYEEEDVNASPHTFTISNTSEIWKLRRGTITIIPEAGVTVGWIIIYNSTTDTKLVWDGTTLDGDDDDQLIIELLPKTCERNFADDSDSLTVMDDSDDWLPLAQGDNDIEITSDVAGGTCKFYWQWSRHYL